MITRVFIFQTKPGQEKALKDWWANSAVPVLKTRKGFIRIRMLKSIERPDTYSFVTDWEHKEDMEAYLDANQASGDEFRALLTERFTSELFEMVDQT